MATLFKTGPLVWNRHKAQLREKKSKNCFPLIWAESVTCDGEFKFRANRKNHKPFFEINPGQEWLFTRKPCVLLQRTTSKEQNRRLIAAELSEIFIREHGAVVVENHLNVIQSMTDRPLVPPCILTILLNSEIMDLLFRCISGSVAVSAYEIEALPLPSPESLNKLFDSIGSNHSQEFYNLQLSNWKLINHRF